MWSFQPNPALLKRRRMRKLADSVANPPRAARSSRESLRHAHHASEYGADRPVRASLYPRRKCSPPTGSTRERLRGVGRPRSPERSATESQLALPDGAPRVGRRASWTADAIASELVEPVPWESTVRIPTGGGRKTTPANAVAHVWVVGVGRTPGGAAASQSALPSLARSAAQSDCGLRCVLGGGWSR
jgi:hypothetical protein